MLRMIAIALDQESVIINPEIGVSEDRRVCQSPASRGSTLYQGPCGISPEPLRPWLVDF